MGRWFNNNVKGRKYAKFADHAKLPKLRANTEMCTVFYNSFTPDSTHYVRGFYDLRLLNTYWL